jgi:uncharacterized OB-fold protein
MFRKTKLVTESLEKVYREKLTDLGSEPVKIGMPVEMVTRRLRSDGDERGIIVYGYKFRPILH